jgi:hypothetical protein
MSTNDYYYEYDEKECSFNIYKVEERHPDNSNKCSFRIAIASDEGAAIQVCNALNSGELKIHGTDEHTLDARKV